MEEGYLSLSDHNYITFRIKKGEKRRKESKGIGNKDRGSANKRWKMETLEQDIFDEVLRWKCETHKIGEWTTEEEVRKDIEWIQQTMIEAADTAIKRAQKRTNKK